MLIQHFLRKIVDGTPKRIPETTSGRISKGSPKWVLDAFLRRIHNGGIVDGETGGMRVGTSRGISNGPLQEWNHSFF